MRALQAGKVRESNLPFEGFLEALCRVAALKALPTPEELVARGKADCQAFLNDLATSEKEAFFAARRSMWGQETRCRSVAENTQVIIDYVFKQIETQTAGRDDGVLTKAEATQWVTVQLGEINVSQFGAAFK